MRTSHGQRLTDILPNGQLVEVADTYTLMPLDQPKVVADHVRRVVGGLMT